MIKARAALLQALLGYSGTTIYLLLAGLFEIGWAIGLKYTEGWTRLWPSVGTLAAMVVSFWCLSQSLKSIPIGTGYAIWTGIGAIGTLIAGIVLFKEPVTWLRILFILMIVTGIIGINLTATGGLLSEY